MSLLAYCVVGVLLAGYVLLDGYDLGMGTLLPFVSRTGDERREALASIAPFWNGNEVWLVAAGGALFALFPRVYASAFSGFYLPFMVLLWLLMGRGIAFEIREMLDHELWHAFWDAIFAVSSALLIVLLGVALGNIVRGVPLDAGGYFLGSFAFLLNPYALAVALLALLALAQHGAAYLAAHTSGRVAERSRRALALVFPVLFAWYALVSGATLALRSPAGASIPVELLLALLPLSGLVTARVMLARGNPRAAFAGSSVFLTGLLICAAATTYPYLLPGYPQRDAGLDIVRSAAPPAALVSAVSAVVAGLILLAVYRGALSRALRTNRR